MVIIFVLLVFVLAQAFLSVALSGRDKQLDRVNRQLAESSDSCRWSAATAPTCSTSIAQLNRELSAASAARDALSQQLAALKDQARAGHRRSRHAARRTRQAGAATCRCQPAGAVERGTRDAVAERRDRFGQPHRRRAAGRRAGCASTSLPMRKRQLADMQQQIAELDKTVQVDKDTLDGEAVRPGEADRAEPRADRAARRAGEAGAGCRGAGDDRAAAARGGGGAACRREDSWAIRRAAQIALAEPAGRRS